MGRSALAPSRGASLTRGPRPACGNLAKAHMDAQFRGSPGSGRP